MGILTLTLGFLTCFEMEISPLAGEFQPELKPEKIGWVGKEE